MGGALADIRDRRWNLSFHAEEDSMAARKPKAPQATPSEVRRNIIAWFYGRNRKGGAPQLVTKVCAGVKSDFGHKQNTVKEHLTYLCDLEFIIMNVQKREMKGQGRATYSSDKKTYRIGHKGIEFMEGESEFSDRSRYKGINISATGGSTILLGDGNVVNSHNRALYDELSRFKQAVADSTELNDSQKLEASVGIETIKDQLALEPPDQTIIELAWDRAQKFVTGAALVDFVGRISPMLAAAFP